MLRDETSFRHKLKGRHTKSAKDDDAEVKTVIWDSATSGVMGEEFSSKRCGIYFDSLRKRMARQSKNNVLNSFINYKKLTHGLLVGKYIIRRNRKDIRILLQR